MDAPTKDEIAQVFKKLKYVPGNKVRTHPSFYNTLDNLQLPHFVNTAITVCLSDCWIIHNPGLFWLQQSKSHLVICDIRCADLSGLFEQAQKPWCSFVLCEEHWSGQMDLGSATCYADRGKCKRCEYFYWKPLIITIIITQNTM